jgi:hypothetical protein
MICALVSAPAKWRAKVNALRCKPKETEICFPRLRFFSPLCKEEECKKDSVQTGLEPANHVRLVEVRSLLTMSGLPRSGA